MMITEDAENRENADDLTSDDNLTIPVVENLSVPDSESVPVLTDDDSSKAKSGLENPNFVSDHP